MRMKEEEKIGGEFERTIGKIREENEEVRMEIQLMKLKIVQSGAATPPPPPPL